MNTVIVPVDFSETSLHAAKYAAELLTGHYGVTMLLYHSCDKETEIAEAENHLQALKIKLREKFILVIDVLVQQEEDFIVGLERAVRHRKADLVIMGITGRSAIAQTFIGSNTLKFAETKTCPVLIIQEHSEYREIKNVMLASDFQDTFKTTPSGPIKEFLKNFRPQLHVVNVDSEHYIALTDTYEKEKQDLIKLFEGFKPSFYFLRMFDINEALTLFAQEKNIDLIISIQKNQSFREKLFKRSQTKSLSYESNVPILVVHE